MALRHVHREAVKSLGTDAGLRIARMIGTIGYRSREEFDDRFSWEAKISENGDSVSFEVAEYLEHQAEKFAVSGYDPNCYLTLSLAGDLMALSANAFIERCSGTGVQFMFLPYSTYHVMPPSEMIDFAKQLRKGGIDVHA